VPLSSEPNAQAGQTFPDPELGALEKAIRRIVRAHDLQSRALMRASGLTAAQLVVLRGVAALGEVTTTALSTYADLSPATVITVLDNLEDRGLIARYRSTTDRRIVHTRLTEKGRALMAAAPAALDERLAARFRALGPEARRAMLDSANALAALMERDLDEDASS
jgi:DNA-binding MarR family transcriptional regulator